MNIVKTKSFELATISKGDENAKKLLLVLPGRLDTKDYASCVSHVKYFGGSEYLAVTFDPPGTWDSPGSIDLFTTTNYIKAVNELIEFFGNRPTFLLGHSRGGTVAVLSGTSNASVIGIATVMANLSKPTAPEPGSITSGVKASLRDLPPGNEHTKEQKEFALSANYFKDGEKYLAGEVLKTCNKPKLIFSGTDDAFSTVEEVSALFEKIPEPKQLHELKTTHDYRLHPEVIEEVNRTLEIFLKKI